VCSGGATTGAGAGAGAGAGGGGAGSAALTGLSDTSVPAFAPSHQHLASARTEMLARSRAVTAAAAPTTIAAYAEATAGPTVRWQPSLAPPPAPGREGDRGAHAEPRPLHPPLAPLHPPSGGGNHGGRVSWRLTCDAAEALLHQVQPGGFARPAGVMHQLVTAICPEGGTTLSQARAALVEVMASLSGRAMVPHFTASNLLWLECMEMVEKAEGDEQGLGAVEYLRSFIKVEYMRQTTKAPGGRAYRAGAVPVSGTPLSPHHPLTPRMAERQGMTESMTAFKPRVPAAVSFSSSSLHSLLGDQLEESNTSDREGSEGSLYEYRNESEGSDSLASGNGYTTSHDSGLESLISEPLLAL